MRKLTCMLVVMIAMGLMASVSYASLEDGLVGYWSLNGTCKDGSGNGNHGVIVGNPRTVDGVVGQALDFDGDDGVEIASSPSVELPGAFTAACWVYPRATKDAAGNDHGGVFWKGSKIGWGADVYNYRIATSGDAGLTFGACGNGVESHFKDANCFVNGLNSWYHVAYTGDGSIGVAYVNGVEVGNRADAISYDVVADQPVRIGWSQGRGGDIATLVFFDGIIDEVVLYDRALSLAEVTELMEQGLPTTAVEPAAKLATTWSSIKAD